MVSKHKTFKSSVPEATSSDISKAKITVSTDLSSENSSKNEKESKMTNNINCINNKSITVPCNDNVLISNLEQKNTKQKQHEKSKFNRAKRTTFMFFLLTLFFFISYTPHLTLKILASVKTEFVSNMSFTDKVLYNTFIYCFFINNMANCFIYGFCDFRFRTEVYNFYNKFLCRNISKVRRTLACCLLSNYVLK